MIKPIQLLIEEAKHLSELAEAKDDTYFEIMDNYDHLEQAWEIPAPQTEADKVLINLTVEHIITLEQSLSYFDNYFMASVDKDSAIVRDCNIWLIPSQAEEIKRYATYLEDSLAHCDNSANYHYCYGERNEDGEPRKDTYLAILKQQLLAIRADLGHCDDCEKSNADAITILRQAEHAISCINQTLEFYYGTEKQPYNNIHFGLIQVENLLLIAGEEYRYFEARTHERHYSNKYDYACRLIDDTLKQF